MILDEKHVRRKKKASKHVQFQPKVALNTSIGAKDSQIGAGPEQPNKSKDDAQSETKTNKRSAEVDFAKGLSDRALAMKIENNCTLAIVFEEAQSSRTGTYM